MNDENKLKENEAEVIDVEEFAKAGKPVPRGKRYRIRVDKERFTVDSSTITGREILSLVRKAPDKYNLYQHIRGERPMLIAADYKADLTGPGVERFSTMKIENTEGKERTARRSFKLPTEDEEFLNNSFEFWESIMEANSQWVIIEKFPLPEGFDVQEAAIALRIAPTYPDDQIDMAYFYPSIFRADGKAVRGLSPLNLDGKVWQQWSRHRVGNDAWRPDIDGIETHLLFITAFLSGELQK